jgi:hypothetical protein
MMLSGLVVIGGVLIVAALVIVPAVVLGLIDRSYDDIRESRGDARLRNSQTVTGTPLTFSAARSCHVAWTLAVAVRERMN